MNKQQFATLMAAAQAAYDKEKLDEKTVEIYWNNLGGFEYAEIELKLKDHIKTHEFFPRISDLRPADHRPRLGPRYLDPPRLSKAMALANKVMLRLLVSRGPVTEKKLDELVFVKNAEANDIDDRQLVEDIDYRTKFVRQLQAELEDQLNA